VSERAAFAGDFIFYWFSALFLFPFTHSATSNHDLWTGLATLMTLLETVVDANKDYLVLEMEEGLCCFKMTNSQRQPAIQCAQNELSLKMLSISSCEPKKQLLDRYA
jgi:hypothetical protein